ncbi:MAG: hypothetical protein JNK08_09280 [Sediminibacterium sp.]|nr:hypothetical protein [Sediminibacterium sp.]
MEMVLIPGYRDLLGTPSQAYEELVKDLPSEVVISLIIMINSELNAPIPYAQNQERIRQLISWRFEQDKLFFLNNAFNNFRTRAGTKYSGYVFGHRYLIAMLLKEFNRNAAFEFIDTSPQQEYNFLLAYFLIVDEVNLHDNFILANEKKHKGEPDFFYRILWTPQISQYQFNERVNVAFELFKLLSFSKYAYVNYRAELKQYINSLNFSTIGQFLGSFYQVAFTTLHYDKNVALSKLAYIIPTDADESHLTSLMINAILGRKETIKLADLKKFPLFRNTKNEYMVMDADMYNKKMYRGPFFDLLQKSDLKKKINFNKYSAELSKNMMESICFKSIMEAINISKHDCIHFDDDTDTIPDCYFRKNNNILLVEFKAYLFPEAIPENPDFETIKKYIDQRFVENSDGKSKGITQLINQIVLLDQQKFDFDKHGNEAVRKRKAKVYPIICFDDFYFTMPGINDYLNNLFQSKLAETELSNVTVKPVTLISLESLFDFTLLKGVYQELFELIDRYWEVITKRKKRNAETGTQDTFMASYMTFDEAYHKFYSSKKVRYKDSNQQRLNSILGQKHEYLDAII